MSRYVDSKYLLSRQYRNSSKLGARIRLHQLYSTNPYEFDKWLFDQMLRDFGPVARILELGSGRGDLWARNLDRIPEGWDVVLSDFSDGMLTDAQAQLGSAARRFDIRFIDAQAIGDGDQSFDHVVAHMMLYHVPDRSRALREIQRILKPNGYLHASTLGVHHMQEMYAIMDRVMPGSEILSANTERPFSLENGEEQLRAHFREIDQMLYESDLRVTEVEPLVDYLLSLSEADNINAEQLAEFRDTAQQQIDETGYIFIRKHTGLFRAKGPA